MTNATIEEQQTLQQRCEMNNLILTDDEPDSEGIDEEISMVLGLLGENFHELTEDEQVKNIAHLFASVI